VENPQGTASSSGAAARWWRDATARRALRGFLRTVRQIVGAPDYERYLEHQAARHPECPALTPREYYAEFVTRRFGGAGPTRCC